MAISVNWGTKVIAIPKADMTLTNPSPETRELDVDQLRLDLKALEWGEEGMPFLDTHRHNTEVTLAGVVYARIFEIINGYTIEFEDGQYIVDMVNANHNVIDVSVINQVSLRSHLQQYLDHDNGCLTSNSVPVSSASVEI